MNITEQETQEDPWSLFEKKLEETLTKSENYIALHLVDKMGAGLPLLEWLEGWHKKYIKTGKYIYIVPANEQQYESLEFSPPDKEFNYVSSVEELDEIFNSIPKKEVKQEKKEAPPVPEKKTLSQEIEATFADVESEEETEVVYVSPGDTVAIAGEYSCLGCGSVRMWMKGKEITTCQNPECFHPDKGWKLDFDLF